MCAALAAELERARSKHGLTLSEIEERCGLARSSLRAALREKNGLTIYNLGRLLHAFGATHWLIGAEDFIFFIPDPSLPPEQPRCPGEWRFSSGDAGAPGVLQCAHECTLSPQIDAGRPAR